MPAPTGGHAEPRRQAEAGVTLMEIMVALGILSVVLLSLGGLMFQVNLQTRRAATLSYLSAAVQIAQTRVEGLPWDSLGSSSVIGCTTDTTGRLVYTQCTTVRGHPTFDTIRVVLLPTGILTAPPETVTVYRAKPRFTSPFTP
jgi:prepilin-type N-terminal cleavage/methylation domain-containing protein